VHVNKVAEPVVGTRMLRCKSFDRNLNFLKAAATYLHTFETTFDFFTLYQTVNLDVNTRQTEGPHSQEPGYTHERCNAGTGCVDKQRSHHC